MLGSDIDGNMALMKEWPGSQALLQNAGLGYYKETGIWVGFKDKAFTV